MRLLTTAVLCTLLLAGGARGAEADELAPLDERLQAALDDLRQRDPEVYETLREALGAEPESARRQLSHHAGYLDERAEAEAEDPHKFELMLRQEQAERRARTLVEQYHAAGPGTAEAEAAARRLRLHLQSWFELRQAMRRLHVERFAERYQEHALRFEDKAADREAARREWLARITEGGPLPMQRRIGHLGDGPEELEPLAPVILRLIGRHDPQVRRDLARLAERAPEALPRALRRIAREHPRLIAEARRRGREQLRLHAELREAAAAAHELLLPLADADGAVHVPADRRAEVEAALDAAVDAELAIARAHLDRAEEELARKRHLLEFRRQNKDFIVDLQLARLLGRRERYRW